MANFIFPLVITLEQKYARRLFLRAYLKNANKALSSLPCSHKKKRPLMLRLANYVTSTLLLNGPRLHVGVSQNNSANQLAMTGCKVAAQSVACAHHCFDPA